MGAQGRQGWNQIGAEMTPRHKGCFITFEGPEGGGKTTQSRRLIARLEKAGFEVVYTREPGGTPTGEAIRGILQHDKGGEPLCDESEVLLFAASRAQLVRNIILPALHRGSVVVCDRFADSTTAYQGYGRGFPLEQMKAINSFAVHAAVPDVTVLLDIPSEDGMARLVERHRKQSTTYDRIERESLEFHKRVREGYLMMAEAEPGRFLVVDARKTPDEIETAIWERVRLVLPAVIS